MLLDLEDLDIARRRTLSRPRSDRQRDQPPDFLGFLPGVERSPFVRADHKYRVLGSLVAEEVHCVRMVVEANLRVRKVREREAGKLEPSLGIEHGLPMAGPLDDQHEQPVGAEPA